MWFKGVEVHYQSASSESHQNQASDWMSTWTCGIRLETESADTHEKLELGVMQSFRNLQLTHRWLILSSRIQRLLLVEGQVELVPRVFSLKFIRTCCRITLRLFRELYIKL